MSAPPKKSWSRDRFYPVDNDGVERSYPSVTTVNDIIDKPALKPWAAKLERALVLETAGEAFDEVAGSARISRASFLAYVQKKLGAQYAFTKRMRTAADIGTLVHKRIEWEMKKELGLALPREEPVIPEQDVVHGQIIEHPAHKAYGAYRKWREAVKFKPLFLEKKVWSHKYAYAGTTDGAGVMDQLTVLDWKTSERVYWEMKLQLAAYGHALVEMGEATAPLPAMVVRFSKTDGEFEPTPIPWEEQEALFTAFRRARMLWQSRYEHEQA